MLETIFITIPAYEDLSLKKTIEDALVKASNPERLFFVVALQYKDIDLPDLSEYYNNPNFNFITHDVDTRPGIIQLRHDLATMHNNEDYFLMIDAHMSFAEGWDQKLINDYLRLQELHGDNVIMSKQLPDQMFEHACSCKSYGEINLHAMTKWKLNDATESVILDTGMGGWPGLYETPHQDFYQTNYSSHHCWFATMEYVKKYGIMISGVASYCEETYHGYRVFMNGWRIYAPNVMNYISHNFSDNPHNNFEKKSFAPRYDNQPEIYAVAESFAYNTGRYAIPDSNNKPYDFYDAIGLGKEYLEYMDSDFYKNVLSNFIQNQH